MLSLKRKLLEEKTVNGRLDQLLLSSDRERTAMKEQMKRLVSADQSNADLEALRKEKVFHFTVVICVHAMVVHCLCAGGTL